MTGGFSFFLLHMFVSADSFYIVNIHAVYSIYSNQFCACGFTGMLPD